MKVILFIISIFLITSNESSAAIDSDAKQLTEEQLPLPKMIKIPAGSFEMGCVSNRRCEDTEKPVHEVSVAAFSLSATEVVFDLWDACVEANGCRYSPEDKGWGRGQNPVIYVSFTDVTQQFIPWLNHVTGEKYRLPSEAEWEYAARAGTKTPHIAGECLSTDKANFSGIQTIAASHCPEGKKRRRAIPVASFPPNAFGLFNMEGNVYELTQDCWNYDYNDAPSDSKAWGTGECDSRVSRGGHHSGHATGARLADRGPIDLDFRSSSGGFRLAKD